MLYKALKVAAGRINFVIDQEIELNDAEAAELLADGAIAPVSVAPVSVDSVKQVQDESEAVNRTAEEAPATTTKKRSK